MKSNIFTATIHALKLPVKLLAGLIGKSKAKSKNKLEQKQRAYVKNFDPNRLKNRTWQSSIDKNSKKKKNGKRKNKQGSPTRNSKNKLNY